jgi:hypothetical protein
MPENESIPIGSASVEAVEIHEESPVIDVHPPHGAVNSWREFWIHLATIIIGLLIAISLEQTVEWVHHLHQRHELQHDLRSEGLRNQRDVEHNLALYEEGLAWLLELQRRVDTVRDTGGKAPFVYPERPEGAIASSRYGSFRLLSSEVWTTAEESALIELLPRDEAEIYAVVYNNGLQAVVSTRQQVREQEMRQVAFETRFSHGTYPPLVDFAKLTPQQLDEYEALLADQMEAVRVAIVRLKLFRASNDYALSGGVSSEGLRQAFVNANAPR